MIFSYYLVHFGVDSCDPLEEDIFNKTRGTLKAIVSHPSLARCISQDHIQY